MKNMCDKTKNDMADAPLIEMKNLHEKYGFVVECEDGKPARWTMDWSH